MLVPGMSLSEIKKAVVDDYNCEIKSKMQHIEVICRSKWIRNGRKDFAETIAFPVKSRNTWRMTVTCNKSGVNAIPYLISYDKTGITASHIPKGFEPVQLMHFNAHFFKRYRERAKIAIDKPEHLVKNFFRKNLVLLPCYYPRKNGTQQLFTPLAGGVGLGNYHPEPVICEFKTFVDNSLLRKDQIDEVNEIWLNTVNELTAEINKRLQRKEAV